METLAELQSMLKRLEAKWDSGTMATPQQIVSLDKQIKEVKRRIQTLES